MKILRTMFIGIGALLGGFVLLVWVVMSVAPSFGGDLSQDQKRAFESLENFDQGKFRNRQEVPKQPGVKKTLELAYKFFTTRVVNGRPSKTLPIETYTKEALASFADTRLIWMGHSTFLLQHQGKNILLDPMFGPVPAPFTWLGDRRFSTTLPFSISDLPPIDAVLISHDHYDHLDYTSIQELHPKVKHFFVPLGVDNHLLRWGVPEKKLKHSTGGKKPPLRALSLSVHRHNTFRDGKCQTVKKPFGHRGSSRPTIFLCFLVATVGTTIISKPLAKNLAPSTWHC